jgi:signal transduction histidine kinase
VLAGGLAHDLSNLLVTALGNASLAKGAIPGDSPAREKLERIETAARRGSDLPRQLLAYAGRGTVVLEPVALNGIVEEMKDLPSSGRS